MQVASEREKGPKQTGNTERYTSDLKLQETGIFLTTFSQPGLQVSLVTTQSNPPGFPTYNFHTGKECGLSYYVCVICYTATDIQKLGKIHISLKGINESTH